jgi:hypothetical protein
MIFSGDAALDVVGLGSEAGVFVSDAMMNLDGNEIQIHEGHPRLDERIAGEPLQTD